MLTNTLFPVAMQQVTTLETTMPSSRSREHTDPLVGLLAQQSMGAHIGRLVTVYAVVMGVLAFWL
jgi:hypothetical protein